MDAHRLRVQFRHRIPRQGDQPRRPAESLFRSDEGTLTIFQSVCARRIAECGRRGGLRQTLDRPHRGVDRPTSPGRPQDCGPAYLGTLHAAALDVVAGQRADPRSGRLCCRRSLRSASPAWRLPSHAGIGDTYMSRRRWFCRSCPTSWANPSIAIATRSTLSWFSSPRT